MIPLSKVIYDVRARDGTWCAKPPKCMNFPKCPNSKSDFKTFGGLYDWYAVIEEFNIDAWEKQKNKEPHRQGDTRRQLRNPRHWQKGVMKRLKEKALKNVNFLMGDLLLEIPEAHGVDVVLTMAMVGVKFEWGLNAKIIRKVMLIGKPTLISDK